jgi:hypothetical protein
VALALVVIVGAACSDGEDRHDAKPPLGFGVDDEAHLARVLMDYSMSKSDAECVAQHAFAAGPPTAGYADGSYSITEAILADAGVACDIDWSIYDFTTD